MRLLFVGDVVGQPGMQMVRAAVPWLRATRNLDLVVVNAENATNGSGLSPKDYKLLRAAGVDVITMGDHIYKRLDLTDLLTATREPICKPANYPTTAPGREWFVAHTAKGSAVAVVSVMGRTYMRAVDCPFTALQRVITALPAEIRTIVVDIHAEATADKYQLLHHFDGQLSAILGTHTHVPTADEQVTSQGTAFQCDVGMTGPYASILGRRADRVLQTAISFVPCPFDVATGDIRLGGAIVTINPETGRAQGIERLCVREADLPTSIWPINGN